MEKIIPTLVSAVISFCLAIAGFTIKNTIYKRIDSNEEELSKLSEKVNKIDKDTIRHEDLKDIQKDIKDIRDCYIKKDDFIRSIDGIHGDIKNLENLIINLLQGGKDE